MLRSAAAISTLLWLLAASPACAADVEVSLPRLDVWPPDATVSLAWSGGMERLGRSDEPLRVTVSEHSDIHLVLSAPGFQDHALTLLLADLRAPGPIRLVADSPWIQVATWVRFNPLQTVALAATLGWGAWWLYRRQQQVRHTARRVDVLQSLSARRARDPLIGTVIGNYRLLERIGEGGMAVVYEAVDDLNLSDPNHVALKVIRRADVDAEFADRFRREVVITSALNHPGIVRVVDFGEHVDRPYLVMELLHGKTLKALCQGGPMPAAQVVPWLVDILQAVDYAHTQGIVHRDLKPANIFIRQDDGRPVVMDFGVARDLGDARVTASGWLLGTAAYMAPEQVEGLRVGPAADQYALGVVAYELLSGHVPFQADDTLRIANRKLREDAPRLQDQPSGLASVVERMLARRPEDRFDTLAEIVKFLVQS